MTTAFNLGSILGAQIRAVLEAEADNAEAIAEFITTVGFDKKEGEEGLGKLRMIEFDMQRRNESGDFQTHTIRMPLLSILPIPMLSIEKADFEFDLKIHDVIKQSTPKNNPVLTKVSRKSIVASFARKRLVKPSSSPSSSSSSTQTLDANMSVKVSVVQTDFPLGVDKLLNLSEIGIQDITKEDDNG